MWRWASYGLGTTIATYDRFVTLAQDHGRWNFHCCVQICVFWIPALHTAHECCEAHLLNRLIIIPVSVSSCESVIADDDGFCKPLMTCIKLGLEDDGHPKRNGSLDYAVTV